MTEVENASVIKYRNPLILIAVSTNDALGAAAENIGRLLARRNIYFVPFGQDDPIGKNNSLVAKWDYVLPAIESAHAVAYAIELAKKMERGSILVCLSGRGDKDMDYVIEQFGMRK